MNQIFVCGLGVVSPAGWGVSPLHSAFARGEPLDIKTVVRPGWKKPLCVRAVPPPEVPPVFSTHTRLRRASVITVHTVAAALDALGSDAALVQSGALRLGVVVCTMAGSVAYSRRFYEEVLRDPATASPAVFPETVFNAPASHLAAYLGTNGIGYTLVGDDGTFLQGLAMAADWLLQDQVDGVIVIGAQELDWVVSDAMSLFQRDAIHSAGAGAIYLRKEKTSAACAELAVITDSFLFTQTQNRTEAARKMRGQLPPSGRNELLVVSSQQNSRAMAAENLVWSDWSGQQLAPKQILGEAFTASVAWQCVAACDAMTRGQFSAVNVSVVGANQQAIGARFLTLRGERLSSTPDQ